MEAKKAPVESVASVTYTFETSIASKNATQCRAITNPQSKNISSNFKGILSEIFLYQT